VYRCAKYSIDFIALQEHRWQTDKEYEIINSQDGKYKIIFASAATFWEWWSGYYAQKYNKNIFVKINSVSDIIQIY